MPTAQSRGVPIEYEDQGGGEPALLFLPGWCVNRSAFDGLSERTRTHRRTLALDWQGHGESGSPPGDFGTEELVENALAVVEASGVSLVVPVAQAQAGWMAVKLRRRLGERVPALVLLSWLVLDPSPPFLAVLQDIRDPNKWQEARGRLFGMWTQGVDDPAILRMVREDMGAYGFEMWSRACREVEAAYRKYGNPLRALAELRDTPTTLHLYALPPDPAFLEAQQAFAGDHPWFQVRRIEGKSHFPMLESRGEVTQAIEDLLKRIPGGGFAGEPPG